MRRTDDRPVSLPELRAHIAAGWVPLHVPTLLALLEAIEADHHWHILGTQAAWKRREQAFAVFDYGDRP